MKHSNTWFRSLFASTAPLCLALLLSACGPKDSVEDNETPKDTSKTDPRSRLTGGGSNQTGTALSYCKFPLDLGTVVDPRRPGLTQTVLSTAIDSRCASFREAKITLRSRLKITLVGRFFCQNGMQSSEQICTISASELLSPQKTTLTVQMIAEESLRAADIDATAELL